MLSSCLKRLGVALGHGMRHDWLEARLDGGRFGLDEGDKLWVRAVGHAHAVAEHEERGEEEDGGEEEHAERTDTRRHVAVCKRLATSEAQEGLGLAVAGVVRLRPKALEE